MLLYANAIMRSIPNLSYLESPLQISIRACRAFGPAGFSKVVTNDLKWKTNTENMIKKGFGRLWMIQRLKVEGASINDHKDVLIKKNKKCP